MLAELPVIGLLRLDRGSAPSPPALDPASLGRETNSYLYRVKPITVAGLDLATVRGAKPLSAAQAGALDAALAELEKQNAISIVSDSGLMVHYQMATAAKTKVPVLLSPLLQAPLLACILKDHETVLVITGDSKQFSETDLSRCLVGSQLVDERAASRFVLKGCEGLPGFSDSGAIDLKTAQTALCDLVRECSIALQKAGKPLGCILLECATLPAFADVLRGTTNLPVFDNLTLSDFAHKVNWPRPPTHGRAPQRMAAPRWWDSLSGQWGEWRGSEIRLDFRVARVRRILCGSPRAVALPLSSHSLTPRAPCNRLARAGPHRQPALRHQLRSKGGDDGGRPRDHPCYRHPPHRLHLPARAWRCRPSELVLLPHGKRGDAPLAAHCTARVDSPSAAHTHPLPTLIAAHIRCPHPLLIP